MSALRPPARASRRSASPAGPSGGPAREPDAAGPAARVPGGAIIRALATLFGVGYLPIAPATWASLVVAVAAYLLVPSYGVAVGVGALVSAAAGVWLATETERMLGHDAHPIVIDEVAGMLLALLFVPHTVVATALAFFAFRFFDVVKVEPANVAQRLPRGWGVMTDDLVAGVYANVTTRLVLVAWHAFSMAHHAGS